MFPSRVAVTCKINAARPGKGAMHGQASRFVAICHGRMTGATLRDSGRLTNLVEVAFACPPPAAEAIARRARARRFAARAVLIRQGEQCA
ncbi:MAG: hypothetical protein Q7J32_16575, partial [Sphingomonadaceae bacterium]|nr:hypothetical protein [Sphingomonadaceae bacterium]